MQELSKEDAWKYELGGARSLARWLKKVDIPVEKLKVGDIVCDGCGYPYFVATIKKTETGFEVFDHWQNGGEEPKGRTIRIIPRRFIAEHSYD